MPVSPLLTVSFIAFASAITISAALLLLPQLMGFWWWLRDLGRAAVKKMQNKLARNITVVNPRSQNVPKSRGNEIKLMSAAIVKSALTLKDLGNLIGNPALFWLSLIGKTL